jgi:hypothetical protein
MLSQQLQIIPTQRKTQKSNWLQTWAGYIN